MESSFLDDEVVPPSSYASKTRSRPLGAFLPGDPPQWQDRDQMLESLPMQAPPAPSTRPFFVVNATTTAAVMTFLIWLVYFNKGTPGDAAATSSVLPALNAALNGVSAAFIAAALWAIKKRRIRLHATLVLAGVFASGCFLVSYIYYHLHHGDTRYTGTGWIRPVYFTILISHVLLSMVTFPMILTSLFQAVSRRWRAHRRLSPYTWAAWMYVSVSGVVVYVLLHA